MKAHHSLAIFLALLPLFVTANIWDNLFLGQGVAFKIPENFTMVLSSKQSIGKIKFEIQGSADLNCLSITQGGDFTGVPTMFTSKLATYKVNFTAGTLHVHSALKDCIAVQDKKFNISSFYHLLEGYVELASLLISREQEGDFYKVKAKNLLQMIELPAEKIPDIVFYFDINTQQLKKVGLTLADEQYYDLDVVKFQSYKASPEDFSPPKDWDCENQKSKKVSELDPKEMYNEVKDSPLLGLLKNMLPENFTLPELPDLSVLDNFRKL